VARARKARLLMEEDMLDDFLFWIEKNWSPCGWQAFLGEKGQSREAAVGRIYMLYTLAEHILPNSPSSSQGESIFGPSGSFSPCLHIYDTRSRACLSTGLGLSRWKSIGPRRVNPDLDGRGGGLGSMRCTVRLSVESLVMTRSLRCLRHGVVLD
jgi:hypothetical protein